MNVLKRLAAALPASWQDHIKRTHYRRQIKKDLFATSEPEYKNLHTMIAPGDWVIDVGANVGHYTKRFSQLVGPGGRVIAFEPVPATFALLSQNAQVFQFKNITLFNTALSDKCELVGMNIPSFETGLKNFYEARVTVDDSGLPDVRIMTIRLDSLEIPVRVALAKIDAEGHELAVLRGMVELLRRDHPTLIVETSSDEVISLVTGLGYETEQLAGSPNRLFRRAST
jgi:FkbM family methyltransferase